MARYLILYLLAIGGLVSGVITALTFLTPLSLALLLFGSLLLWRLDKRPVRQLGFPKNVRWPVHVLVGFTVGIGIVLAFTMILSLTNLITISPEFEFGNDLWLILLFTFLEPILFAASEEVIFRGVYFQVFRGRFGLVSAAILSAGLWAILHLPTMFNDGIPLELMVLGFISFTGFGFGLACLKVLVGNSLWMPFGVHYGYNVTYSFLGAAFMVTLNGDDLWLGVGGWIPETGLVSALVWLVLTLIMFWIVRNRQT